MGQNVVLERGYNRRPVNARPLKTLERVLSKAGAGSRVDARKWIRAGRVSVNGHVVRDPDYWVAMKRDRLRLDGKPLRPSAGSISIPQDCCC